MTFSTAQETEKKERKIAKIYSSVGLRTIVAPIVFVSERHKTNQKVCVKTQTMPLHRAAGRARS